MAASTVHAKRHVALTGPPGIGKTTLVRKICDRLKEKSINLSGFYTIERREREGGGKRIGFDVVPLPSGLPSPLARLGDDSPSDRRPRVGRYVVDVASFESAALPRLASSGAATSDGIVIVDEIGKMELFSRNFEGAVRRLLDSSNTVVVATLPIQSRKPIPFVEAVRRRKDVVLFDVTTGNRDNLVTEVLEILTR